MGAINRGFFLSADHVSGRVSSISKATCYSWKPALAWFGLILASAYPDR